MTPICKSASKQITTLYALLLLHKVKTQCVHFRLHANYFLFAWKILEEISRRSMLFNNWRLYLLYQTHIHTVFYHRSGLTCNGTFNGSIFDICTYSCTAVTLYGSILFDKKRLFFCDEKRLYPYDKRNTLVLTWSDEFLKFGLLYCQPFVFMQIKTLAHKRIFLKTEYILMALVKCIHVKKKSLQSVWP